MTTLCLTRDHLHVIAGIARGRTLHGIAHDLGLAHVTIRQRLRSAADAVGILTGDRQAQLVDYAYRHGYLDTLRPQPRPPLTLTPDLQAALDAYARGLSTSRIAGEMGIKTRTARTRRDRLLRLMGARSPAHAVALAWQHGHRGAAP